MTARTLLRGLALFPDRLDPAAEVDDMLVTLLPGESAVFHVTGAVPAKPDALGTRPVLRCVNDTVAQTDGGALANGGAALAIGPSEGGEFPSIPFVRLRTRQPAQACANAIHEV